jgi:TolB-like protein
MSFIHEIRRRKVVRVALVYVATAFAVVQAADVMLPRMGVPEWVTNLVVALAVLGLPIALVLAWALELTPDGVRVTRGATADPGGGGAPALLGGRTIVVVALLLAVGVGLGAGLILAPRTGPDPGDARASDPDPVAAHERSIAVLPFADFSPDGGQEWFSDGLAEEILNALARLPDLRVASRTGSFQFRDRSGDVRAIADSLGVAHILEGSVRWAGDRVRITAQLIRASDDAHLWSQNFDRNAADVIRVQEEIAYEIARTLQTALDPEELARIVAAGTNSVAAHEAFLRARHLENRAVELEDFRLVVQAYEALEQARQLDPQFYRAHLAAAEFWFHQLTPTSRQAVVLDLPFAERQEAALERLRAAEASAPDQLSRLEAERARARLEIRLRDVLELSQRIVEIEPNGENWNELGYRAMHVGRYDLAREAWREAAARHEETRFGIVYVAMMYHRVDPAAAVELVDRWLEGDPTNLDDLYQAHRTLLAGGRVQQAAALAEHYLARSPSEYGKHLVRIRQLCAEGRTADAAAYYESLDFVSEDPSLDETTRWHMLHYLGRRDEAVEILRHYDDAGELFVLSTFLDYTFFDPRPYPNLSAALRRNGALRPEPRPVPYGCPPEGG